MEYALLMLGTVVGAGIGGGIGYRLRDQKGKKMIGTAEARAAELTKLAEDKHADILQKAKEKAIKILEDARLEEKKNLEEVKKQQASLLEREEAFSKKLLEIDEAKAKAESTLARIEEDQAKVETLKQDELKKLEDIAKLTKDEALARIMALVEEQNQQSLVSRIRKLDEQSAEDIERRANNILAVAIQRQASSHVAETTTSWVEIPSEEMKGRIIGREGRNIKAIELLTGCELIVDETPGIVTVTGFSPIRRQVAKRALEKLIADGRIHPGRIEEMIEESKKELALDIKKAGEEALFELGISPAGFDPKLIQIIGRLKYRTSYGQNALLHSLEVAKLATIMGEELGADLTVCRKGGLLHDIGKAVDHDMQGTHPELGYQIMKKFGFPEEICYQSIGHHEDKPKTLEAVIIKAADAISGARPGARKDSLEFYVKRLEDLENAALSFDGVEKVYAIQAGREIRVFVNPKAVDDFGATKLAREIAAKIEAELKHPGEIRVTLIRETRIVEYAR
jgi:ribonuclease Y